MIAQPDSDPNDNGGHGTTSAQGNGPCSLGAPEGAVTSAPVADPSQLWLPVARLEALKQPSVSQDRMSWPALAACLQVHEECADKDAMRLWSPSLYNEKRRRRNDNVVSLAALVFDFDGCEPEWERLDGLEYVAHTTFSHGFGNPAKDKPPGPYWRVIIPLAVPVSAEDWKSFWEAAHYHLAPTADAGCCDASRAFFNPSVRPGGERDARYNPGRVLDPREIPPIPEPEDDEVLGIASDDDGWAVRPGDDYSAKTTVDDVIQLLEKHGAEVVDARGGDITYLRRPGKDQGTQSGSVGYKGTNLFYCFSSAWPPFEADKAYKPFGVYALLEHDGDFQAASAALHEEGCGKQGSKGGKADKDDEDAARALRAVRDAADTAVMLSDFAPAVKRLLNCRQGRRHKETLADVLAAWGIRHGRLLVADDGGGLSRSVFLVDDDDAVIPLVDRSQRVEDALARVGINGSEATFNWTVKRLRTAAVNEGARPVKLEQYVARRDGRLYISCGPTKIVVAEAGLPLRTVRNGADGVLFQGDAVLTVWNPEAAPVDPLTLAVLQPNLETPPEAPEYTPDAQRLLFRAMLISMIAGQRPLPAIMALGSSDGGKTSLTRGIVRLILGGDADVCDAQGDARDFNALISSLPLVAIDNLDGDPPPWLHDALATAVTGARVGRRVLYTDGDVSAKKITATLLITSRTANFAKRNDIMERLFPLFVTSPKRRRADSELYGELAHARDGALAWLARRAADALARSASAPDKLPGRFVDWARTVWALDPQLGPVALEAMARAQQLAIVDPDELGAAIVAYLRKHAVLEGTPTEIVELLDPSKDLLPHFGGGKAIARRLRELAKGFLIKAGVKGEERSSGNGSKWRFVLAAAPRRASVGGEMENLEIFQNSEGKMVVGRPVHKPIATRENWGVGTETSSTFSISPLDAVSAAESILAANAEGHDRQTDRLTALTAEAALVVREIPSPKIAARPNGKDDTAVPLRTGSGEGSIPVGHQRDLVDHDWDVNPPF